MDEPSASLSEHEVQRLFGIARALRDAGVAVLYISHRLEEVFALADTVTVMRDGRHVSTRAIEETSEADMVAEMVGRDMQGRFARTPSVATDEVMLDVRDLTADRFRDVSFALRKGEIACFSGLVGAGRTDVALALFGIVPATSGTIHVDGAEVAIRDRSRLSVLASPTCRRTGASSASRWKSRSSPTSPCPCCPNTRARSA